MRRVVVLIVVCVTMHAAACSRVATPNAEKVNPEDAGKSIKADSNEKVYGPAVPAVSNDFKVRLIACVEKCSKMNALVEQGVNYTDYKRQLAEMRSSLETLELVGWPKSLQADKPKLEAAIQAWTLGGEIWETKLSLAKRPYEEFRFSINAYERYGAKLEALAKSVTLRTGDKSAEQHLEALLEQQGGMPTILADQAIRWCFTAGGLAFKASREAVKGKLDN